MVIKEVIGFVNSLGGKEKSKRDREHDEQLFESLSEIISSTDISNLCSSLIDEAEYYTSQFEPLLEAYEFIDDGDNEFIDENIEDKSCNLSNAINELWQFVQEIVLPHYYQDEEDDRRYTFNYKLWDREIDDYESASREFDENMRQLLLLCGAVQDAYKSFRDQVREVLAM